MLKAFRSVMTGVGAWIVLALVVLAFAFVGLPQLNTVGRSDVVRVGDTGFSAAEIENEYTRRLRARQYETGEILSREEGIGAGILDETTGYFQMRALAEEEAEALGLTVTDEMVQEYLTTDPSLTDPASGEFDQDRLDRVIQMNGYSLAELRERLVVELLQRQLASALAQPIIAPDDAASLAALRRTERRTVAIGRIPLPQPAAPDDGAIAEWYEAHRDDYAAPERRTFTYVALTPDSLGDRIELNEDEIRQLYDARAPRLGQEETRSFRQGQFPSEEAAAMAADAVGSGVPFVRAVTEAGGQVTTLTDRRRGSLTDPTVAEAVFSAPEAGTLVGPIDGTFGYVLAEVTGISPASIPSLEDVRPELEAALRAEVARDEIDRFYEELQARGDSGASLAAAAEQLGLPVNELGPVAREDAEDLPAPLADRAFSIPADGFFEEVILEDGVALLSVEGSVPSAPRPLSEVRGDVLADLMAERRGEAAANLAEDLRETAQGETGFAAAVTELGGRVERREINFLEPPEDLDPSLLRPLFTGAIGQITVADTPSDGELTTAVTESVRYAPNAQIANDTAQYRRQIGNQIAGDLYDAYLSDSLAAGGSVRDDRAILNRLGIAP